VKQNNWLLINMRRPCFTRYCCKTSRQYTPHRDLSPLNVGLMPFGWLRSISLNPTYLHYYLEEQDFWLMAPWFTPKLSGKKLGHKSRALCVYKSCPTSQRTQCTSITNNTQWMLFILKDAVSTDITASAKPVHGVTAVF